jgi:hypothetical protein
MRTFECFEWGGNKEASKKDENIRNRNASNNLQHAQNHGQDRILLST